MFSSRIWVNVPPTAILEKSTRNLNGFIQFELSGIDADMRALFRSNNASSHSVSHLRITISFLLRAIIAASIAENLKHASWSRSFCHCKSFPSDALKFPVSI